MDLRRPVLAAGTLLVLLAGGGCLGHENDGRAPRPAGRTSTPAGAGPSAVPTATGVVSTVRADLDGDGIRDDVRLADGRLDVRLSATREVRSLRVGRTARLSGPATVDGREVVALGSSAVGLDADGRLRPLELGWFFPSLVWADGSGRLLTGYAHARGGTTYLATYWWLRSGADARPAPVETHCVVLAATTPLRCGDGTFVGSPRGLPALLPQRGHRSIRVGGARYDAPLPGGGTVAVRMVASGDRRITVRVGAARLRMPDDGDSTTYLLRAALEHDGDLVLIAGKALGDGSTYRVLRYDGTHLEPVRVDGARGWRLAAGGPAVGGPASDTWISDGGRIFTARSELGVVVYERIVEWVWSGDRLVPRRLPGPVCLDDLGGGDQYGRCDFG